MANLCPETRKPYRSPHGMIDVDSELKTEWLDRLNSLSGIDIDGTCAGHQSKYKDGRSLSFYFHLVPPLISADTMMSSAMRFAAAAVGASLDGSINVMIPDKGDPDSCRLQFLFKGNKVKVKDRFGPTIDTFAPSDEKLSQISESLDKEYAPKGWRRRDMYEWDFAEIYIASELIHTPSKHRAIDKWWSNTLNLLESIT